MDNLWKNPLTIFRFLYARVCDKEQNIKSKIIPLLMVLAALVCLCI